MRKYYGYDDTEWTALAADSINEVDSQTNKELVIVTDAKPATLSPQAIKAESTEFAQLQERSVSTNQLSTQKSYTVVTFGLKITRLFYNHQGKDPNGFEYLLFTQDEKSILVYLGDPNLLIIPEQK